MSSTSKGRKEERRKRAKRNAAATMPGGERGTGDRRSKRIGRRTIFSRRPRWLREGCGGGGLLRQKKPGSSEQRSNGEGRTTRERERNLQSRERNLDKQFVTAQSIVAVEQKYFLPNRNRLPCIFISRIASTARHPCPRRAPKAERRLSTFRQPNRGCGGGNDQSPVFPPPWTRVCRSDRGKQS